VAVGEGIALGEVSSTATVAIRTNDATLRSQSIVESVGNARQGVGAIPQGEMIT